MISKEDFIGILKSQSSISEYELEELDRDWDDAMVAAVSASASMPGIGFASAVQRVNAFLAVCRHLDQMIEQGYMTLSQSQLTITILRLSNNKFKKAVTMFDLRANRFNALARSELPSSAREYLAGIVYMGQ